jgi:photosystem II stability/assembly factor-like uncharacterized protein
MAAMVLGGAWGRTKHGLLAFVAGCSLSSGILAAQDSDLSGWVGTGPFGGSAEKIALSATDPHLLLAGTKTALLFRSRDGGSHWQPLAFPREFQGILQVLAIDLANESTYYVGVSEDPLGGLYRSVDAGKHWELVPGFRGHEVFSFAGWQQNPAVMAVGTRTGVFGSKDSGKTWQHVSPADNSELQQVVSLGFDPLNADVIYAGTPHLPWKTEDGGQTWASISKGIIDDSDILALRVDPLQPGRVFIGACSGIYRTSLAGGLWEKLSGIPSSSRRTYALAQDPRESNVMFAGTSSGFYKSLDAGSHWSEISTDLVKSISVAPDSSETLYLATDTAGVVKSNDGGLHVMPIDEGFTNRILTPLTAKGQTLFAGSIEDGLYSSIDAGLSWKQIATRAALQGENISMLGASEHNTLFAVGSENFLRSVDLGRTWKKVPAPLGRVTSIATFSGPFVVAGSSDGIFRSADSGLSWKNVPLETGVKTPINAVFVSEGELPVLAALSRKGLFVSEDLGRTWQPRSRPADCQIYQISLADRGSGLMLAATSLGLFRSIDQGRTWTRPTGGVADATVNAVLLHPLRNAECFAVMFGKVLRSTDYGASWQSFDSSGLEGTSVRSFKILPSLPDRLLVVTAARGVFVHAITPGSISSHSTGFQPSKG